MLQVKRLLKWLVAISAAVLFPTAALGYVGGRSTLGAIGTMSIAVLVLIGTGLLIGPAMSWAPGSGAEKSIVSAYCQAVLLGFAGQVIAGAMIRIATRLHGSRRPIVAVTACIIAMLATWPSIEISREVGGLLASRHLAAGKAVEE